ncbi:MAG: phosphate ABC transporter permease PstA [Dehalococcoidia bacterium]
MNNEAATQSRFRRRKVVNGMMTGIMGLAAVSAVLPLVLIIFYVLWNGLGAMSPELLLEDPNSPGRPGGGVRNAIAGSAVMVGLGVAIGAPVAIGCGIFLAEYGQNRLGTVLRFLVDVLAGMPSITIGLFMYGLVVLPNKQFMALAGALALAIILLPIVARITEEMLLLVPRSLREAAYALGAPRWRTVVKIVLPTALPGIVTGLMLAVSRIAGEAAPLLFTSLGNQFLSGDLLRPMDALPSRIYTYAVGPFDYWHEQAWAMSLLLVVFILVVSIAVRAIAGSKVTVRQ